MTDAFTEIKETKKPIDIHNMNYQELCHLRLKIEKEIERRLVSLPY